MASSAEDEVGFHLLLVLDVCWGGAYRAHLLTRAPPEHTQHDTALAMLMQHIAKIKLEKEEEAWALSSQLKEVNSTLRESLARQQALEDELVSWNEWAWRLWYR